MRRYNSIQISPGRFPALDGMRTCPGEPKPRLQMPRDPGLLSPNQEAVR
jgi:hypothetical protein